MSKSYAARWYLEGSNDVWPMVVVGEGLCIEELVIPVRYEDGVRVDERYVRDRGSCHAEEVYLDSHSDLTATVCSACRVAVDDLEDCNFCPNCGAKVVEV